jgi:hypothetical protein
LPFPARRLVPKRSIIAILEAVDHINWERGREQ